MRGASFRPAGRGVDLSMVTVDLAGNLQAFSMVRPTIRVQGPEIGGTDFMRLNLIAFIPVSNIPLCSLADSGPLDPRLLILQRQPSHHTAAQDIAKRMLAVLVV